MVRGIVKVREILVDEHREMQSRVYRRIRPYLAGTMYRLRRNYPAFLTTVFNAEKTGFAFIFNDGTQTREAPKAFECLSATCKELVQLSEIEWLAADDSLWQVKHNASQPKLVREQYRHIQDKDWRILAPCPVSLRNARYYMRQEIYSRTVYGSHRPGYGRRLVDVSGVVIDEWVDPIELMILRALHEKKEPVDLAPLCDAMNKITGFRDGYYTWDVLHACARMVCKGTLQRINDTRFAAV